MIEDELMAIKTRTELMEFIYKGTPANLQKIVDSIVVDHSHLVKATVTGFHYKGTPYRHSAYSGPTWELPSLHPELHVKMVKLLDKTKKIELDKAYVASYLTRVIDLFDMYELHQVLPECLHNALPFIDFNNSLDDLFIAAKPERLLINEEAHSIRAIKSIKQELFKNLIL